MTDSDTSTRITLGVLREALISVMDLGGAWGQNMHESKEVLIQAPDGTYHQVAQVAASFVAGRFVLTIKAGDPDDRQ